MAACMFIMDDTLRLMEWLAYHYTVLPLGDLVVAIDPHSRKQDRVLEILDSWRPYINIHAYTNDTWLTLKPEEGWGRQVFGPKGQHRHWFTDTNGDTFKAQSHKRRQNFFFSSCLQNLYTQGIRSWTVLIDSDEFMIFNYRHPSQENASEYDAVTKIITAQDIDKVRERIIPIRDKLPHWHEEITIADFLTDYSSSLNGTDDGEDVSRTSGTGKKDKRAEAVLDHAMETAGVRPRKPKCLRFPHLRFSSYESNLDLVKAGMPPNVDPTTLMTLRQRKVGPMDSLFSKAMLDLSQAKSVEWFNFKGVVNVHTPSRRMCGRTTKVKFSGSGTDYISSLFRIHHYRSGTIETYLERSGDYRGSSIWRFYAERNILPSNVNDDIVQWIHWFIRKIGEPQALKLLLQPMEDAYQAYQHHEAYAGAKEVLERLQGDDPLDHSHEKKKVVKYNYTKTTKQMAACVFVSSDNMKLTEWIAYHYTVLPLGALVVGISSLSNQDAKLRETIQRWSSRINITIWSDDEWLKTVEDDNEWKRSVHEKDAFGIMGLAEWYQNKSSEEFLYQSDLRRENVFAGECLLHHHKVGREWTVLVDPSEFILFNYKGPQENPVKYDSREAEVRTKDDIIEARTESSPIRDRLPGLFEKVTIADFLANEQNLIKCVRMPGLDIGPREFGDKDGAQLLTTRQREFGVKRGTWVKVIVDVSLDAKWKRVESTHNLPICGWNGRLKATDYIASLLRFHRFDIGTLETFVEHHPSDNNVIELYKNVTEDFEPFGDDHGTLTPWVDWFVEKVGKEDAEKLLFLPLAKAYTEIRKSNKAVKEAREDMENSATEER